MRPPTLSTRAGAVALALLSPIACTLDFDQFAAPVEETSATATGGASSSTSPMGGSITGSSSSTGTGGAGGAAGTGSSVGPATGGSGGAAGGADGGTGAGGAGGAAGSSAEGGPGGAGGGAIADASDARPRDAASDTVPPRDVATEPLDAAFNCASVQGTSYQGHCYFPILGPYAWNVAAMSCPFGAHLVTITSAGEQAIAAQVLPARDRWIGMRKDMNSPDVVASYFWLTNEPAAYSNWDLRDGGTTVEPNFSGDCVRMQFNSFWADDVCTSAYPALCERE